MNSPKVAIVMGSKSDLEIMEEAKKVLDEFGVIAEMRISSAHRSPIRTSEYARAASKRGIEVIIAGAGGAAHLAGALAANSLCPVIGVPIDSTPLQGLDALLSTVQMPSGIPVATMGIGKMGARNAGLFAVHILAIKDPGLIKKLQEHRRKMEEDVDAQSTGLDKR